MNVVFNILEDGKPSLAEKKFCAEAEALGMVGLPGHRSIGGIRASIYNSQPLEAVQELVEFMKTFKAANKRL
jgi:phosphoserine aminotransferase